MPSLKNREHRPPRDVVLGGLLVLGGVFLVAYASWATKISVLYVGWLLFALGLVGIIEAFPRRGRDEFWSAALGGIVLMAVGMVLLRNPTLGAVSLTLVTGALFLVNGLVRLAVALDHPAIRSAQILGGVVSTLLGLILLFDPFAASLTLLGILLGLEIISEGLVRILFGSQRDPALMLRRAPATPFVRRSVSSAPGDKPHDGGAAPQRAIALDRHLDDGSGSTARGRHPAPSAWVGRLSAIASRCRYSLPGCWLALVFACLSFTPSLLPRPALFQGVITGIDAAIGYALGVLGAWVWREFADRGARTTARRSWQVFAVAAASFLLMSLAIGEHWQNQAHELVDTNPQSWLALTTVPVIAGLLFVALVAASRALRRTYRRFSGLLERYMGARAARALGLVLLVWLGVVLVSGVLWNSLIGAIDQTLEVGDMVTPAKVAKPTTGTRSASPQSLVDWDSLGREGRVFVGRGPNAADISAFTGQPALDPIRVYAGVASAMDTERRADLAVRDLERAGGFKRAALLVVTTTGTGWVEPSAVGSFEYLQGGDTATIAIQYSHLPSWLSFLVDQGRAREAGRLLFDAVYERWVALPASNRPKLYVFGESLGSFGGETAFSGEFDLRNRTDGALFVGPPNFNPLYRSFVDDRDRGSPEVTPVYRRGRTIRFTDRPRDPITPVGQPWNAPRVLYMQHPSDPITWWSPDLILHRPDWLSEPRGRDVLGATRWIPFVTFWQVSADLALGFSTEPGHGHNYSGEHVDGWAAVLQPHRWSRHRADQLRAIVRSGGLGEPFDPSHRQ